MNKTISIMLLQLCFAAVASSAFAVESTTFTCVGTVNPAVSTDQTVIEITTDQSGLHASVRVSTLHKKMFCGVTVVSIEAVSGSQTEIGGGCGQRRAYDTSVGELEYYANFANATLTLEQTETEMTCALGTTEELQAQEENN